MKSARKKFNWKRRIQDVCDTSELTRLARCVKYVGSEAHKRHKEGDFNITPNPDSRKTLCDGIGITSKLQAHRLLRKGIIQGLISEQKRGDFPQNIWAVTSDGIPLEAQLTNEVQGVYHGYPMPSSDDLRNEVIKRWSH